MEMRMEMKMSGSPIAIIYLPVDGGVLCFRLRSTLSQPLFLPHAAQSARFLCIFRGYVKNLDDQTKFYVACPVLVEVWGWISKKPFGCCTAFLARRRRHRKLFKF